MPISVVRRARIVGRLICWRPAASGPRFARSSADFIGRDGWRRLMSGLICMNYVSSHGIEVAVGIGAQKGGGDTS